MADRPLSPHLSVYKFKYTLLTSILNRLTGLAISFGLILLAYWLTALSRGASAYDAALPVLAHCAAKVVYGGVLVAFCYHLVAGIRHLVWDAGRGLEKAQSQRSAWVVAAAAVLLAGTLGYLLFCPEGAAP
jgi:succinate dehydrogenase / fumarate reductase cytochrome b subunit